MEVQFFVQTSKVQARNQLKDAENLLECHGAGRFHWRRWRDGRVAEGGGLLNRNSTFSVFAQNANKSQWVQCVLHFRLSRLAARHDTILTRNLSATVGNFRLFGMDCGQENRRLGVSLGVKLRFADKFCRQGGGFNDRCR